MAPLDSSRHDLGPYNVNVPHRRAAQAGGQSRTFTLSRGTKQAVVELTADAPEPQIQVSGPSGAAVSTAPLGTRTVGDRIVVVAPPGLAGPVRRRQEPGGGQLHADVACRRAAGDRRADRP